MKPHQLERANSYVREELSLLIGSSVADPRVHALIVTDVDLSADRRTARVYVGCYDETVDLKEGLRGLENAKEYIR
ncbi:MAG: ribosome-binding factor A, partial [Chloroflexi bacterium]|nr:ribosome-binding factor A [Chloroflexota bacterium]